VYDVIVVGARCAGAPTAMLLARRGYDVLLLDRATFPSDTMRNHFILYRGMRFLQRWGLLDRLAATNCPPTRRHLVDLGDFPLVGFPPAEDSIPGEYAPRRIVLDQLLVAAAVEAGVTLQEGCPVDQVLLEGDRVTGVQYRTPGGAAVSATARTVVGADGQHSLVARTVRASTYQERPVLTCGYYSYWSGVGSEGLAIHVRDRPALVLSFPTNDGLACVAVQWPIGEFRRVRADIEGNFFQALELVPELATRVRQGTRAERFRGTADLPNFFRRAAGPGWALAGDAGVHKDPFTASGISDAFRDAELLAEGIDAGLTGHQPLDEALANYGRQRDAAVLPHYDQACQSAAFAPIPQEVYQLRALLRGHQPLIDRYMGVGRDLVSGEEFASPERVQQLLASTP
jgi:2-polyprenyl-6-methoxyphenol hydroxylase-like FAD-dependent oxidoreductase